MFDYVYTEATICVEMKLFTYSFNVEKSFLDFIDERYSISIPICELSKILKHVFASCEIYNEMYTC